MLNIHIVLDRTGSMQSMAQEARQGFNQFVKETMGESQRWWVWQFDSIGIDLMCDGVSVGNVPLLNEDNYQPRAGTPLYDAVGQALVQAKEVAAEKNVFVVLTDGEENSSKEWTAEKVKEALREIEDQGWQVVFIAANPEAWSENAFDGTSTVVRSTGGLGMSSAYMVASATVQNYAADGKVSLGQTEIDEEGTVRYNSQ